MRYAAGCRRVAVNGCGDGRRGPCLRRAGCSRAGELVDAGEAGEAIGVIGQAEPLLREIGARRALRRIESLRERDELRALAVPVQVSGEPSPASIG